ncbi:prepilin-type N-terminal cleavage/methylation domain-containing protein [Sedimentibacter sp.]|uniref:prepilin-type N-terminal cleavage/methylation domain-containing protein n=1 Tax=Sedimentibacter sp. TaxID=1960295 RepID=UPI0028AF2488|nr:prepilin-type N-terminal cleavage/methylation domain-containing protein [Sedimentibacter sp.]
MNKKGYTLIEIITVFSLIGILIGLSIPKITNDFGYLDNSSEELLRDVRYIQTEAMKNPLNSYKLIVNSIERSYYIVNSQNNEVLKSVKLKDRYTISYTGTGDLYFNSGGVPIHPGTFKITDARLNKSKEITVVVATGRTIILE